MDPVSVALLLAVAGGAGGALGDQVWRGLGSIVGREFRRNDSRQGHGRSPTASGMEQFAELAAAPRSRAAAEQLATALAARAQEDLDFAGALLIWRQQAQRLYPAADGVHNEISGGTFHGAVTQGVNVFGGESHRQ
jgi:hypothetical protein